MRLAGRSAVVLASIKFSSRKIILYNIEIYVYGRESLVLNYHYYIHIIWVVGGFLTAYFGHTLHYACVRSGDCLVHKCKLGTSGHHTSNLIQSFHLERINKIKKSIRKENLVGCSWSVR